MDDTVKDVIENLKQSDLIEVGIVLDLVFNPNDVTGEDLECGRRILLENKDGRHK